MPGRDAFGVEPDFDLAGDLVSGTIGYIRRADPVVDHDRRRLQRVEASAEQGIERFPATRILGLDIHTDASDVDSPVHAAGTILAAEVDVSEAIPPATKAAVLRRGAASTPIGIDVRGSSMGTAIPSGARVFVVAGVRPRRGEVWAFVIDDGVVIVHRFRRERDGALWFQGDGNARVDRPVTSEMLVGRVVATEVGGRRRRLGRLARARGRVMLDTTSLIRLFRRAVDQMR
jgi:hypothetical protein